MSVTSFKAKQRIAKLGTRDARTVRALDALANRQCRQARKLMAHF